MPVKKLSLKEINARPLGNGLITDEERNSPSYKKWMKGRSVSKALDKKKSKSDQRSSGMFKKWIKATDGEWDDHN